MATRIERLNAAFYEAPMLPLATVLDKVSKPHRKPVCVICQLITIISKYFRFKCIHIDFPGKEILQATLAKYRKKSIILNMVNSVQDYDTSFESLEKP